MLPPITSVRRFISAKAAGRAVGQFETKRIPYFRLPQHRRGDIAEVQGFARPPVDAHDNQIVPAAAYLAQDRFFGRDTASSEVRIGRDSARPGRRCPSGSLLHARWVANRSVALLPLACCSHRARSRRVGPARSPPSPPRNDARRRCRDRHECGSVRRRLPDARRGRAHGQGPIESGGEGAARLRIPRRFGQVTNTRTIRS